MKKQLFSVQSLKKETYRTEAVVAGYHGRTWILHPSVVEVAASASKLLHEFLHASPCAGAQTFGTQTVMRDEYVSLAEVACVLYRVLVSCGEVRVRGFSYY